MADNLTRSSESIDNDVISNGVVEVSWPSDLSDDIPSLPFDDVDDKIRRVADSPSADKKDLSPSRPISSSSTDDINTSNVHSDGPSQEMQPERETTTSESSEDIHVERIDHPQESTLSMEVTKSNTVCHTMRTTERRRSIASQCAVAVSIGLLPASLATSLRDDVDDNDPANIASSSRTSAGHTYPVSRRWLRQWLEHLKTTAKLDEKESINNSSPGPLNMDSLPLLNSTFSMSDFDDSLSDLIDDRRPRHSPDSFTVERSDIDKDEQLNQYVPEVVWRHLASLYGVAIGHPLDRKLLNGAASFNDRVDFEVCLLSAFSGIVAHHTRRFNRFEEIGYIEFQLRRIFGVSETLRSESTRMWISEREVVPPLFRVLPNRNRMLNDHLQRDRKYILALEVCRLPVTSAEVRKAGVIGGVKYSSSKQVTVDVGWPTGKPGESKGDLSKYIGLLGGVGDRGMGSRQSIPKDDKNYEDKQQDEKESSKNFDAVFNLSRVVADLMRTNPVIEAEQRRLVDTLSAAEAAYERVRATEDEIKRRELTLSERKHRTESIESRLMSLEAEITARRQQLDTERARMHRERDAVEQLVRAQASRIRIDIGGTVFETSRRTMIDRDPTSLLAAMFADPDGDGVGALKPEDDGSFFVDRDGVHFRYIMEYLRNGAASSMPIDVPTARHLLCEAKFYRLRHLVKRIEDWLVDRNASIV